MRKLIALSCLCLLPSASAAHRTWLQNALVVPKCTSPPKVDGRIEPKEYARAAAVTGLQHIFGWVTERQPVAYVTYDDRKLYIAVDSRFPADSKLRRVARERDHKRVCADDTIEVWIAPDFTKPDELEFQFLGNSLEVIQDFMRRPNIGNNLLRWNGHWDFKCTSEPGRWHSELAIDLAELRLKTDQQFGINLCRDYAKYHFTAWTSSRFRNYAQATFGGDEAPAVQLLGLGNIRQADLAAQLRVEAGRRDAEVTWLAEVRLEEDGSVMATGKQTVSASAGQTAEGVLTVNWADKEPPIKPFEGLHEGSKWTQWIRTRRKIVKLTATDAATGQELMRHQFFLKEGLTDPVATSKPRAFEIFTDMYPTFGVVRCGADVYDFERKSKLKRVAITLQPVGKPFAVGCGSIDTFKLGFGQTYIKPLPLMDGEYEAVFHALGDGDESLARETLSFQEKSFPWQGTSVGVSDEVIAPFTPLAMKDDKTVSCWGREYGFGGHGLPEEIITRGVNVLAAPVALAGETNGHAWLVEPTSPLRTVEAKPGVVRLLGYGRAGPLRVESRIKIEYDGMMKFHLRLRPDEATTIDSLSLVMPLHDRNAKLFHACGESIRLTNRAGYVPKGEGLVWTSKEVPNSAVLGSFIPYFWVGDYDRGLCWMADNDRGWSVDDEAAAVEFLRRGKRLSARVNFFTKPKTVDEPLDIVFALMAGPPKPEPQAWRLMSLSGSSYKLADRQRFRVRWFYHAKTFQGFGKPPDMTKYLDAVATWQKRYGESPCVNMSPNDLWGRTEENLYYGAEWYPGYPSKVRNDYVMHNLDALMIRGRISGLYSDDVYPVAANDTITGIGYVRDDGKVQTGYRMFALRDFYKRTATLHRKHGCKLGMLVHMTDSMVMPAYCFWDAKHDNEWGSRIGKGRDHIDSFPLGEICARTMSRQYGMAASWHTPAPGHGDDLACLVLLHDIVGRIDSMDSRTLPAKLSFGIDADDVEFLGYWELQPDVDPQELGVKMSAWVRRAEKTALLVVANLGQEAWSGKLAVPLHKLRVPRNAVASDGEENHPRLPLSRGKLTLSVPRHNYRIVLLGPPGKLPVDEPVPGAALPRPAKLVSRLCDDFNRREPGSAWKLAASPVADGEVTTYRNRLCVKGRDYKFAAAERQLGIDNIRIQVRVERRLKSHSNRVGLALLWPNGACAYAGVNTHRRKFEHLVKAPDQRPKQKHGGPLDDSRPGNMHQLNWVRLDLSPDKIRFHSSADGKRWTQDWECARPAETAGPPATLRLGKNPDGEEARHLPTAEYVYFDDLVIGHVGESAE